MFARDGRTAYLPPRVEYVKWETGKDWSCHVNDKEGTSTPHYYSHTISYAETFQDREQYRETYLEVTPTSKG